MYQLTTASPYLTTLTCAAEYAPSFPKHLAHQLGVGTKRALNKIARFLAKTSDFQRAMLGTTTAVDVINGGVKVNALPEVVTSLVNFRIDFDESIAFAQDHVEGILAKVAKKHGLEFIGFGDKGKEGGKFVKVEQLGEALEPAPRTPSEGPIWELFAGTVKCVF
jgi:Gly-Xaa carboxypeptidase